MKRLLALDGGGIRGVFSLEVLLRIETLLREKTSKPDLVLADYFDYMAGTSTGAIIATCLSWGMTVREVRELYVSKAMEMFKPAPLYRRFWNKFEAVAITRMFQRLFSEDGEGREPALLSTTKLRTLLTIVMRNHTTGSPWPVSNNPAARYNDPALPHCNLKLPLWQLVRASTAAPVYFPPEVIELGSRRYVFVDGGITPYNNPALLLFLMATAEPFRVCWPTGTDQMLLVSIGTGQVSTGIGTLRADQLNMIAYARSLPLALMEAINVEQDLVCRTIGRCVEGEKLDNEIGDLRASSADGKQFVYARYNHLFTPEEIDTAQRRSKVGLSLDNLALVPFLREVGAAYAEEHVRSEQLM